MKISIVVAVSLNNVIGNEGKIPWNIPEDLKHFREITSHHHVLMGRKTYESIGHPLPKRTNLILTTDPDYKIEGCYVFNDPEEAINFARENGEEDLMVIGGEQIYRLALPVTEVIHMTRVLQEFKGDAFFPQLRDKEWRQLEHELHDKNNISFEYRTIERIR